MKKTLSVHFVLLALIMGLWVSTSYGGNIQYGVGSYAGYFSIDSIQAAEQGIDDEGFVIGLRGDAVVSDIFTIGLGLGFPIIDDKAEFSQVVRREGFFDDDFELEDSDITGVMVFGELGFQIPFAIVDGLIVGARGGYLYMDLEREIIYCDTCRVEDVNIDDGFYTQPFIAYLFDSIRAELAYNNYLDGDGIEDMWRLSFVYMFGSDAAEAPILQQ